MEEKVKKHLNNLFSEVKETDELNELKKELHANFLERTTDLLTKGYDENTAFEKACIEIGDLDELVTSLEPQNYKEKSINNFFKDFLHGLKQILISKYGVTDAQSEALVIVIIFLGSVLLIALAGAFAFKVGAIVGEAQAHWKYGR